MYVTWWSASKRYTRVCANNWLPLEFESLCDVGARTCITVKFWHQRQNSDSNSGTDVCVRDEQEKAIALFP